MRIFSLLKVLWVCFDGGIASTAELAKLLNLEVLLVIDARSSAESNAAVLKGFESYDPEVQLGGGENRN